MSEPPVPVDCDLRSFPYMPLDVVRLRDSDMAAIKDPEAFRAAVLLWCAAWHQVPAASLPNNDEALARLAGYGRDLKTWKRARAAGALRGWNSYEDGRLYHPVVAEKAREAWDTRQGYKARLDKARRAKAAKTGSVTGSMIETDTETIKGSTTGHKEGKGREGTTPNPLFEIEAVTSWSVDSRHPDLGPRPVVNGTYLDWAWERVAETAKIEPARFRGDLKPLAEWLSAGIEPEEILAAIRRVSERENYIPPFSLAFFDRPVRERRARAA